MPPEPLGIALVVPAHVGGPGLDRCLAAVAGQHQPAAEVVVVADGPVAAADPALRAAVSRAGARLVASPQASGPARARNLGAAATTSPVLFFVDSDVVLPADATARVRAVLADPGVDALFGSYDEEPGDPRFTSQYKNLVHHLAHQQAHRHAVTFWGACGAVRRTAFAAVGGFDESYARPCIEDIELGYRLTRQGWRVVVEPALQVRHLKRWTVRGLLRTDLLDRAVPWSLLILRSGTVVDDLGTGRRERSQVVLTACSVAALGAGLAATALDRCAVAGWMLAGAAVLQGAVLVLDATVLAGLAGLRGGRFALRSLPWRVAHHGVCLLGLVMAVPTVAGERLGLGAAAPAQLWPPGDLVGTGAEPTPGGRPVSRAAR